MQTQPQPPQPTQDDDEAIPDVLSQFVGIKPTFEFIYLMNFATAFVHAISAVIIGAMATNIKTSPPDTLSPYLPAMCFREIVPGTRPRFELEAKHVIDTKIYYAGLIVTFFALSAFFQCAQGLNKTRYMDRVTTNGVNMLRYIEYSISASLMMVAIACILLVFDMFTHILVFTCTFSCMILGLFADYIRVLRGSLIKINENATNMSANIDVDEIATLPNCIVHLNMLKKATHALGWVTLFVPYLAVFFVVYFRTTLRMWDCLDNLPTSTPDTPPFVHLIVFTQFFLFNAFGLVQMYQFYCETDQLIISHDTKAIARIGLNTEHRFVLLSLIARSILGWLVASNILFV